MSPEIEEADFVVRSKIYPRWQDATLKYVDNLRDNGIGPIRLGETLKPNPDIYALLVASNFNVEIIDKHRQEF